MCTWTFLFWVVSKWLARARCNGTHPMKILGRPRSQGARKDGRVYSPFFQTGPFSGIMKNYLFGGHQTSCKCMVNLIIRDFPLVHEVWVGNAMTPFFLGVDSDSGGCNLKTYTKDPKMHFIE